MQLILRQKSGTYLLLNLELSNEKWKIVSAKLSLTWSLKFQPTALKRSPFDDAPP